MAGNPAQHPPKMSQIPTSSIVDYVEKQIPIKKIDNKGPNRSKE